MTKLPQILSRLQQVRHRVAGRALVAVAAGFGLCGPAIASEEIVTYQFKIGPLSGRYYGIYLPPEGLPAPPLDLTGSFSGADLNDDARLDLNELRSFRVDGWLLSWQWPGEPNPIPGFDTIVSDFSYSEAGGLNARVGGYRTGMQTGVGISYNSPFDRSVYSWTAATTTVVSPPAVVPEPSALALFALGGLVLLGRLRGQGRPRGCNRPPPSVPAHGHERRRQ